MANALAALERHVAKFFMSLSLLRLRVVAVRDHPARMRRPRRFVHVRSSRCSGTPFASNDAGQRNHLTPTCTEVRNRVITIGCASDRPTLCQATLGKPTILISDAPPAFR